MIAGALALERVILDLLVLIGAAFIVESFLPIETGALVPTATWPVYLERLKPAGKSPVRPPTPRRRNRRVESG